VLENGRVALGYRKNGPRVLGREDHGSGYEIRASRPVVLDCRAALRFPTDSLVGVASDEPLCYRFRYRLGGTAIGHAVKKRNQWYALGYEGLDPVTGRDRRRWHPAPDEAAARQMAETLRRPRVGAGHGMTLARFMRDRWLPGREGRLRPTTAFRYRQMTERYVLPRLGRVPLRRLTVTHLLGLYGELRRQGRHDAEPLAPKTVLEVHQILRTALGDAERQGLVARNVAR
jgi:hypothetical protein